MDFKKSSKEITQWLLDQISKQRCFACKENLVETGRDYVCKVCEQEMLVDFFMAIKTFDSTTGSPRLKPCDDNDFDQLIEKSRNKKQIFFASFYKDKSKKLMRLFKYKKPRMAKFWGQFLAEYWQRHSNNIIQDSTKQKPGKVFVTAIPLHPIKEKQRGYNQSKKISKEFCKNTGSTSLEDLIIRETNTASLFDKSKSQRQKILSKAFTINPKYKGNNETYQNSSLIIIDDITTTGTTLIEAYKTVESKYDFQNIILLACSGNKIER